MSNNKQSSLEWYIDNLIDILGDEICNKLTIEQTNRIHFLGKQAKAMHKQEVMRAYNASYNGFGLFSDGYALAEIYYDQYYNQNFNNKEK